MKTEKEKHLIHFILLGFALLTFALLFLLYNHQKPAQIIISLLATVFYIAWGIIHHKLEGRLNKSVFYEYLTIGVFAAILLLTALLI